MAERPPLSSFEERPSLSSFEDDGDQTAPETGWGATALDVGKQALAAVPSWAEATATAPAQIFGLVGRAANYLVPGSPENAANEQKMRELVAEQGGSKGIGQYLPEAQTSAGRFTRTGVEFGLSGATAPGRLATNIGAGIVGGLASEAAGQATEGTALEPVARVAGAIAGTGAAQKLARLKFSKAYAGSPVQAELDASVNDRYSAARALNVEFSPTATTDALQGIRETEAVDKTLAPKTNELLERYAKQFSPKEGFTEGVSFDEVEALRRKLSKLTINKLDPNEAEGAKAAVRGIDNFLAGVKPGDVLAGDATKLAGLAKTARDEASANFRMKAFDALRERAELAAEKGQNAERAYRNELSNFIKPNRKGVSPAMKEGFNQTEIAELRSASKLTAFPQLLRFFGAMGGHGWMGIGSAGAEAYGLYHHDPFWSGVGAVGLGGSFLGRGLGTTLMRSRADRAARMIAARSPLARELGVTAPAPVTGAFVPTLSTIARPGLYNVASPQTFKHGGRVTRSFKIAR